MSHFLFAILAFQAAWASPDGSSACPTSFTALEQDAADRQDGMSLLQFRRTGQRASTGLALGWTRCSTFVECLRVTGKKTCSYEYSKYLKAKDALPGRRVIKGVCVDKAAVALDDDFAAWKQSGQRMSQRYSEAVTLQSFYKPGNRLPKRSLELMRQGALDDFAGTVRVFYPEGSDFNLVKKLVKERVPTNINGVDQFRKEEFGAHYGWTTGYYNRYFEEFETLAPNIAVAGRTPVFNKANMKQAYIVNLIGYAFDAEIQADYKYFRTVPQKQRTEELVSRMKTMWRHMFAAARSYGLTKIFYAEVGGGYFSILLADLMENDAYDYSMFFGESFGAVRNEPGNEGFKLEKMGRFPDIVFEMTQDELDSALFVNAWDPLSIVGNGNAGDNSLDGYVGRSTCLGLLSFPATNPKLLDTKGTYIAVEQPVQQREGADGAA